MRDSLDPRTAGPKGRGPRAVVVGSALAVVLWGVGLSAAVLADPSRGNQDPGDDPTADRAARVRAAIALVRDSRVDELEREAAMDTLLGLGLEGASALLGELDPLLTRLRRANDKSEARAHSRLEKVAQRVIRARLDRAAKAEIEAQRRIVLAAAADPNLTKETVHSTSDPAFSKLEELLVVTVNQCFDADEELFTEHTALLDDVERELRIHDRWERAIAGLAASPTTATAAARKQSPSRPERDVKGLLAESARRAEYGSPMSKSDRGAFELLFATASELDPEELLGIHALGRRRLLLGLPVQRVDMKLVEACRNHSRDMVEQGFFAHESPVPGRTTPWDRAAEVGTSASAENIAMGSGSGPATIMQWWYSPGHHRNLLGGGSRTGLGRSAQHWTQLFGG